MCVLWGSFGAIIMTRVAQRLAPVRAQSVGKAHVKVAKAAKVKKKRKRDHMGLVLALLDGITVFGGFFLAYWMCERITLFGHGGTSSVPLPLFTNLVALVTFIVCIIMFWQGVYRRDISHLKLHTSRNVMRALFMSSIVFYIPFFYLQQFTDTRELATIAVVIVPFMMLLQKTLSAAIISKHFDRPLHPKRLLIIGHDRDGSSILRKAYSSWDPGYNPVGFLSGVDEQERKEVDSESLGLSGRVPVLGHYRELRKIVEEQENGNQIEEVWINEPNIPQDDLLYILGTCQKKGIKVGVVPAIGRIPSIMVDAINVGGQMLLREKQALNRPIYDIMKRIVDLVASSMALLLLSPLFLFIGILIKLDSKGPIFFRQTRIGKNGRPFVMYKFRTMHTDSNPYQVSPGDGRDPRITRVGRFLRRTSLDEIPQLINVFKGTMSLVGPRPEMPFLVEQYTEFQRRRLAVKPGITGLWQISADRSIPIHQNLDYDLYYVDNRSLTTDLIILWRTVWTAINGI